MKSLCTRRFAGAAILLAAASASSADAQTTRLVPEQYAGIGAAIQASVPGDIVSVAPGIYLSFFSFQGKDVIVRSRAGAQSTVLNAAGNGPVVRFENGETAAAVLEGFTLRGGSTERGGGILISGASPTIRGCIIRDNFAFEGGGVYFFNSSATLEGCFLYNNFALRRGGGTGGLGGAMYTEASNITLNHLTVSQNDAGATIGHGLHVASGDALIQNSIFHTKASIQRSISSNVVANTNILNGPWTGAGSGNVIADPRFVDPGYDPENPDLHLRHDSPARDAGIVIGVLAEVDADVRNPSLPDIGADEYFRSSHWYRGNPISGGDLTLRANGAPGDLVLWLLAGNVLPQPLQTPWGEFALDFSFLAIPMGVAPASGIVEFTASLPWILPTTFYSQVMVGPSPAALQLSDCRTVFLGGI